MSSSMRILSISRCRLLLRGDTAIKSAAYGLRKRILEKMYTDRYSWALQGYSLGAAQMQFTINVSVVAASTEGSTSQLLQISPSNPFVLSSAGTGLLLPDLMLISDGS